MELQNIVLKVILVGVVVFMLSVFYLTGSQESRPPELPKTIVVLNEPDARSIEIDNVYQTPSGCEWSRIKVPIKAKFSIELKPDEELKVVPIVTFNDQKRKAIVEGSSDPAFFTLTKEKPEFSGGLIVENIVTSERPIRYGAVDNTMKPGDKLLIEAKGTQTISGKEMEPVKFMLKLNDLGRFRGERLSEKLSLACAGGFELECYNLLYPFELFAMNDVCKESGLLEKCQKVISLCNNAVTITGNEMNCGANEAKVSVVVENPQPFDKIFDVGERVGLTFFKNTECVKSSVSVKGLRVACSSDFLGGTYYFTGPVVPDSKNLCK